MSTTIDEKVVEMRFDNRQFEQNVSTTMSTLDKLKQSLNITGASKGLEEVQAAANRFNLSGISSGIEAMQVRFSYAHAAIIHQLNNIVDSAVTAGKRMVSALTIDPIKMGFQEYETKINAIQTIMSNTASKGTTMQDVTRVIGELNTYADKTIYNFAEMTRNIGTFTAAGVGLEESAAAIQGISNLAAASGSNAQQASTAMYQLSQALSTGTVRLMDWNSVVNAGMGGEKFQEALKATAREHGVAVDEIIKKNGSFRDSLQDGWLSADILNETLRKFTVEGATQYAEAMMASGKYTQEQADALIKEAQAMEDAATKVKTFTQLWDTLKESAQSGWGQTWELIVGDFEEAKETLTKISDLLGGMINASAEARNNLVAGGLRTGWDQLLGKGIEDETAFTDVVKKVANEHGIAIDEMIKDGKTFEDTLTDGWLTSDMLSESIKNYSAELSNMTDEELKAAGLTKDYVVQIQELEASFKNGSLSIDEFADKMARPSGRQNLIDSLFNSFNAIMSVINPVKEAFREIFPAMTADQLYAITEGLKNFTESLTLSDDASNNLKRTFKGLFAIFDIVGQAISAVFSAVLPLFGGIDDLGGGILSITAVWGDWLVKLNESIKTSGAFTNAIQKIKDFLAPVVEGIKTFGKSIVDSFSDILGNAEMRLEPLSVLGEGLKAIFTGLAAAVGAMSPIFSALASAVGTMFGQLQDGIANTIQNADFSTLFDLANGGIFAAIGIGIAKFVNGAGDMFSEGGVLDSIKEVLGGVGDALDAFTQSLKADTIQKIAIALGILAGSLLVISLIDSEKLTGSLGGVTLLFGELMGAMSLIDGMKLNGVGKAAASMLVMSTALLILSAAVKIMSTMSWEEMAIGLISMTAGLGVMVGAMNLLPKDATVKTAGLISMATSMVILGAALKIMASMSWDDLGRSLIALAVGLGAMVAAVNLLPNSTAIKTAGLIGLAAGMVIIGGALKIMGSMSWSELAVGLTAFAVSLAAIVVAMKFMPADLALKAVGMVAIAAAMSILGDALKTMGSMSWGELAVGLVALAGSLAIIAGAMYLMTGALPGAAALLVVSAALAIFAPVLILLGNMSWDEIVRGLVTLAGAFAIIGIAGVLLTPLVPTLAALAGSIALFGLGCLAVGAGVLAFAAGITALSVAVSAGGGAIVIFISSLIGLIPYIIEQIGVGIVAFCEAIAGSASSLCAAATTVVVAIVQALLVCVPLIAEAIGSLLLSVLTTIAEYTPSIVQAGFDILIACLEGIANNISKVVQTAIDVVVAFLDGISQSLPKIVEAGFDLMISFINSMADGIRNNTKAMISAVDNLMNAIVDAIVAWFKHFVTSGTKLVGKLASGIIEGVGDAVDAAGEMISDVVDAIGDAYQDFIDAGADLVAGFANGIKDNIYKAVKQAGDLAEDVWAEVCDFLGIESPSKKFIEIGKFTDEGFVVGLKKYAGTVSDAATAVGDDALNAMSTSISGIAAAINNDIDAQPTIRPVLDLSNVESGANAIGGMLSGKRTLLVDAQTAGLVSSSMSNYQNGANNSDVVSAINRLNKTMGKLPSGDTYNVNGVTYDDGSNIAGAVKDIARAALRERRV